jgi:hypothetical protein
MPTLFFVSMKQSYYATNLHSAPAQLPLVLPNLRVNTDASPAALRARRLRAGYVRG